MAFLRDPEIGQARTGVAASPGRQVTERRGRYQESRQAAFVRGGYSFAAGGSGLANGAGAPLFAAGWSHRLGERSDFSFEGEFIYQKDQDPVTIGVGVETATVRSITGLASLRWDGPKWGPVRPYVSGGFGPAHVKTRLDNGVAPLTASDIELGYGARVGVSAPLSRRFALEAGYRFLGASNAAAVNTHSVEAGLVYRF
jgi:opacity protein-like surface antigen